MRLTFKILWFEDADDYVNDYLGPQIRRYLDEHGFDFEPIIRKTGKSLDEDINRQDYDLILADLDLKDTETGDAIIRRIRSADVLTEVLLYSGDKTSLEKIVEKERGLQRVSFAFGRAELPDKLFRIIDLTIRKVQDINNMRGMVITEAVDIETDIESILLENLSEESARARVVKLLERSKERNENKRVKLDAASLRDLVTGDFLTFHDLHDILASLVKEVLKEKRGLLATAKGAPRAAIEADISELGELKECLNLMDSEVIRLRNDMAHCEQSADPETGKPMLINKKSMETHDVYDDHECMEIRKNLRKHMQKTKEIAEHLKKHRELRPR